MAQRPLVREGVRDSHAVVLPSVKRPRPTGDALADSRCCMLLAHSNLGWIIFLAWISIFSALVFRFFVRRPVPSSEPEKTPTKHGMLCGLCGHT